MSERPRAPWGSFPLTELTLLAALGLAFAMLLSWGSDRAVWAAGGCVALGVLAGFEVSLREHLSGYRRHSALLAFTVTVGATVGMFFAGVPTRALAPVAAGAFALAFAGFAQAGAAATVRSRRSSRIPTRPKTSAVAISASAAAQEKASGRRSQ